MATYKERLLLILTAGRLAWWNREDDFKYLHSCRSKISIPKNPETENEEWEGKVK